MKLNGCCQHWLTQCFGERLLGRLLGILGGVESFGLVGIFLGPALMAALVAVWRSWVTEAPAT